MAEASTGLNLRHAWRGTMLIGTACFAASVALMESTAPAPAVVARSPIAAALLAAGLVALIAMAAAQLVPARRLAANNRRMGVALNNMSQGLCMFDHNERLVVCNRRYREMYDLPAAVAHPGTTLTGLLEYRADHGSFARNIEDYRRELLASIAAGGITSTEVVSADGHVILVINRPMAGGGWVATHEDITARRAAERERAAMQEQEQRRATIDAAIAGFRRRVEELLRTVREAAKAMRASATTLLANSGQTSKNAEDAVTASDAASSNVQVAALATDELTGSIGEIGQHLANTMEIVHAAVGEASDTNAQIGALAEAVQKIDDVIKLIGAIAGQTNLLALNATIEAARAGEAGKGFAIVAAEVKSLAVQTARATEDIANLINAVQAATAGAVAAINSIGQRMQEIDGCTHTVSVAVQEQSAAAGQISQSVASAATGAKLVVSALDEVASAATETRRSAESVLGASQAVETAAGDLSREVENFLARVAV